MGRGEAVEVVGAQGERGSSGASTPPPHTQGQKHGPTSSQAGPGPMQTFPMLILPQILPSYKAREVATKRGKYFM